MASSHIVLYETNPQNPAAATMIVEMAQRLLAPIAGELGALFHAAVIPRSDRVVGGSQYQALLNFIFLNETALGVYMGDSRHLEFVRFVLRGWMLEGSQATDPETEFIDYILRATPDTPSRQWARNPRVPEDDVVWAGELVVDA